MGLDVVAELLDLHPRKLLVEALDFLQTENIRLYLLEVREEVGQPLADRVDVPGGDAQAHGLLELKGGANLPCFDEQGEGRARATVGRYALPTANPSSRATSLRRLSNVHNCDPAVSLTAARR